jgi:hypothetical protein
VTAAASMETWTRRIASPFSEKRRFWHHYGANVVPDRSPAVSHDVRDPSQERTRSRDSISNPLIS